MSLPWIVAGSVASGLLGSNAAEDAAEASTEASRLATQENRRQQDTARRDTAPYRAVGQGALYQLANTFGVGGAPGTAGAVDQAKLNSLERRRDTFSTRLDDVRHGKRVPGAGALKEAGYSSLDAWISSMEKTLTQIDKDIQTTSNPVIRKPSSGKPAKAVGLYDNLKMDPGYKFRLAEGEKALQRQQSAGGTRYGGAALKAAARYGQDYSSGEFSNAVNRRNAELGYLFSLAGFGPQGIATAGQAGAASATNNSNILMQNAANQGNASMTGASAINNAIQGGIQNYYTQSLLRNYNQTTPASTLQDRMNYNN
jgi:hypothetical protein